MEKAILSFWARRGLLVWTAVLLGLAAVHVAASEEEEVVKRGEAIGESPIVGIEEVLKDPDAYVDRSVIVRGTVSEVCQKKGCWMELVFGEDATSVRVTFKDYGFFVPKDCHGMLVRAEGVFQKKVLSKEDADHLAAEGASLLRNPDGTASELGFIASGVELMPATSAESEGELEEDPEEDPEES